MALGGKTLVARAEVERFLSELPAIRLRSDEAVDNPDGGKK